MDLTINFIIKIILIVMLVIIIGMILYIKFSSDFFSENSTDNKIKDAQSNPYIMDEDFLKSLEYQYSIDSKLDDINNNFKELNKEITNYKLKLNNIDENLEEIRKEKLSIEEITTNEALDMTST